MVDRSELFEQSWNREKYKYFSSNIRHLIQRTNRLSYWVATNIILHKNVKNRVKSITLFINVASKLLEFNNYNSLMAVIAGINLGPILRLKHTLSKVSKSSMETFKTIQPMLSPANAYKVLRESMETVTTGAIPYIGMFLTDLTYMDENATLLEEDQINFPKFKMIYDAIDKFCKYQGTLDYKFEKNELYDYLFELPSITENDLYNLSYELEPRQSNVTKEL